MTEKFNNQIYNMYEKEVEKNKRLSQKYEKLRFEVEELRYENKVLRKKVEELDSLIEKAVNNAVEKATKVFNEKIEILEKKLEDKDKEIDRLRNQINKNSSNSSKPSSTDFINTKQDRKKGKDTIKYRIGIEIKTFVEKHIFKHKNNSKNCLPKEFYTDVTYDNSVKKICVELGGYNLLSYERVADFLCTISNGILKLSQGTINNFYKEFSIKSKATIKNIINNVMNGKVLYTDETTSKFDGSNMYFRNYSNEKKCYL